MSTSVSNASDDVVIVHQDDISNYNPDYILPESPEEIRKIRSWLNPTDYKVESGEFRKHLASHLPGTGEWLASNDTYRDWLQSKHDGLLWIKGIPGSGKSVLAAHLVEKLGQSRPDTLVLYFFFRQIIDANHEPAALLCDWLDQILMYSPPLQKRLKDLIESGRSISSITMEDHWSNLKFSINGLAGDVFCVADALDEMDQGNDDFLLSLAAFGQWKPDKAKLLMTSRPVPTVETPLRNSKVLSIRLLESDVDIDIETYVNHSLGLTDIASSDQRLIRDAVPGRANGLFLYAKLALDAFLEPGARIQDVLKALPADLHDLYTRLLREHAIRSGVPEEVQLLILQWVTHATRPLRLLELAEMLNTTYRTDSDRDLRAQKDLVRAAAGPLLEILPDETVCVIHHSFTEYLKCVTRNEDVGGYTILRPGPTHGRLAISCLSYLQSGSLDDVQTSRDHDVQTRDFSFFFDQYKSTTKEEQQIRLRYPFFQYAATNWHVHVARSASAGFPQSNLSALVHSFLDNASRRKAWLKLQGGVSHGATPLHIAAKYGLSDYTQHLIDRKADVHSQDVSGKTPLYLAASSGHAGIIRKLISAGAEPDADGETHGTKPLHAAASENHAEAVRALLEAGVDPLTPKTREDPGNWCGNAPRSVGHTPLMYACENGHLEALDAFMPFMHDLDVVHRALQWSAHKGRAKLVRRILQHPGVQVNAKVRGDTALVAACRSANRDAIVTLVEAGADPTILCENWGDEFGGMGSGRMEHYFGGGNVPQNRGFTALHALCEAFRRGSIRDSDVEEWRELVMLLLDKGAKVDQKEHGGHTALHYAVNTPVIVRILLDAGADANAVRDSGDAPLHLVTSPDSISLLVEVGQADIDQLTRDNNGQSPIMILLGGYVADAILKLLEYGPDLTLKDKSGSGPLHIRLKRWHAEGVDITILKALLEAGADPNERNHLGETPLLGMKINEEQSAALVDILTEAGADINAKDANGFTVLSRGMLGESFYTSAHEGLEMLLKKGAEHNVRDYEGRTLLHIGISSHEGMELSTHFRHRLTKVDWLLQKGMDHTAVDYHGHTLLHELALKEHVLDSYHALKFLPLAKQLLALGIGIDQRNNAGRTAVHILAGRLPYGYSSTSIQPGPRNIFELLLATSKDIDMLDNQGLTALHLASTVSELHVKTLLDAGSDPTIASFEGLTPLHLAARSRQINIVGQLLEASTSAKSSMVNVKDERGHTPLYYACRSGRPETVRMLLNAGADASNKELFDACADYEMENTLWITSADHMRGSRSSVVAAAGLTLNDTTRPISALYRYSEGADLDYHKHTTRIEEIVDMLSENGANLHNVQISRYESHHIRDCFFRARERHSDASKSNLHVPLSVLFDQHATKIYREAQLRAVSEFEMESEGSRTRELFIHLLQQRQYHTMEITFYKGVNFLADLGNHNRRSIMHIFVRAGLASLVQQIGDLEAERQFEKGHWHAFNDSSRRGLHRNMEHNDSTGVSMPSLLREAVQGPLPNMEVVRLLVERFRVDLNDVIHHLAIGNHWWHVAEALPYLISRGADVNIRDTKDNNRSALQVALGQTSPSSVFHAEAARVLISAGADVNALANDGTSCLALACNDPQMTKLLVQKGATPDAHALFAAINSKLSEVLETLLAAGLDPNIRRQQDLKGKDPSGITLPESEEYSLWVAATRHGIMEGKTIDENRQARDVALKITNLLLAHGADPFATFKRESPYNISERDDASVEEDEDSALISAEELDAEAGCRSVLILHDLLERGNLVYPILKLSSLDVQQRDSRGRTVLHAACLSQAGVHAPIDNLLAETGTEEDPRDKAPSFLHHLLSRGADTLAVDNQGRNILHLMLATTNRYATSCHPILHVLPLLSDADVAVLVKHTDTYGNTPLHLALRYAIWQGDASPVEALLEAGADPSAQDNRGTTALHVLAYRVMQSEGCRSLFSKMLKRGLDINARNAAGQTPIFNLNKPFPSYIESVAFDRAESMTPSQGLAFFEDAGADVFVRDKQGQGLLHIAARLTEASGSLLYHTGAWAQVRSATRFELLVNKGLDAAMEDDRKRTALDVAAAYDNQSVLKLFDKDNARNKVTAADIEANFVSEDGVDIGW